MRKIYLFFALMMFSVVALATPSFTVSTNTVDFGTVYLDESGYAEGEEHLTVTWNDLMPFTGVYFDIENEPEEGCIFERTSNTNVPGYIYAGYDDGYNIVEPEAPDVWVSFFADKVGSYTCQIHFYIYAEDYETTIDKIIPITVNVAATTTALEQTKTKSKSRKFFRNGRLHIIRNGEIYNAQGAKE